MQVYLCVRVSVLSVCVTVVCLCVSLCLCLCVGGVISHEQRCNCARSRARLNINNRECLPFLELRATSIALMIASVSPAKGWEGWFHEVVLK